MNMDKRERFLNRIADKLGRERRREVNRPAWSYTPQWNRMAGFDQKRLTAVLAEQCDRIHTTCILSTADKLPQVLAEAIPVSAQRIVTWDDPRFAEYGLSDYFQEAQTRGDWDVHRWDPARGEENIHIAERADVGITFSDITLAESGTVVLFSGDGKGRSVSLLPHTYIAIIPQSTIVPRMSHATREIHQRVERGEIIPSCINFISGPSNSADIEMNLVVGVHGPVRATYIVVEDR
ncbi:LutC/YkgG family protein [Desmospora activa]|uniref:Lactate utilization protein C n=1 Tax=Desmospora activa DSM 45169 TaxID=1121389 RepID=A0A2T4ZCY3_9BACL|nr:lactate utilization protein C [Desmospora activa]PTM59751.1 L-lactate dehydrogenase complex protein LldG [Desmospora activa DSM 45169]